MKGPLMSWMETVLIWKCFRRYSNFAHKLNSQLWMETWLLLCIQPFRMTPRNWELIYFAFLSPQNPPNYLQGLWLLKCCMFKVRSFFQRLFLFLWSWARKSWEHDSCLFRVSAEREQDREICCHGDAARVFLLSVQSDRSMNGWWGSEQDSFTHICNIDTKPN